MPDSKGSPWRLGESMSFCRSMEENFTRNRCFERRRFAWCFDVRSCCLGRRCTRGKNVVRVANAFQLDVGLKA